ncbi:inositol monophosphatase 1-like isoform X1 [Haliotis rufescens]|uniref:inositol monophosphatase 1-like isoform X1 n=1 Tax=Haliotis rufescens TaxID=6454 RepID=UPI00201EECB8|nr:inositol monophosphatase 1-like isoform X1 [Haliotis rufescens]
MSVRVSPEELEEYRDFAVEVATKAGEMIKKAFYKTKTVTNKGSGVDLVTETDKAVEKWVIGFIKERYPDHRFIGEETTDLDAPFDFRDDLTWIVDPIDGTNNFVHNVPEVAFSMGLTANKKVIVGVINLPVLDLMYTSMKGHGSYCNGRKLVTGSVEELKKSIVIYDTGALRTPWNVDTVLKNVRNIITKTHGLRTYGAAAVHCCKMAEGHAQALVEYGLYCWDFVAGLLIAQEAGVHVMDPDGGPCDLMGHRILMGCTEKVANELSAMITHHTMHRP